MPQISTRGAVRFARFEYKTGAAASQAAFPANITASTLGTNIPHIREFPSVGATPNIVNVNEYGSLTSFQVAGQSDSETLTFTLNYVPSEHNTVEALVGDGKQYLMGIILKDGSAADAAQTAVLFYGRFESFAFTPSNTDAMTATLTVSRHSDFSPKLTTSS